mgnify:CR=1 FL=1
MKNIILAGAAPDTGNLGVSALLESMLSGVNDNGNNEFLVLDHAKGLRKKTLELNGNNVNITFCGAKHGKRFYQNENFFNIRFSLKFLRAFNPIARKFSLANVILDISGGDSFTDLYGEWRFKAITYPKLIAIENNIPLVLMPQTYGPYSSLKTKKIASEIVRSATMAFARDEESFDVLKELLGDKFDKEKHKQGVDVAFLLNSSKPEVLPAKKIQEWFDTPSEPIIGINVSGLIYNQIEKSFSQYGLKANYREVIYLLIKKILDETNANIILIPHVLVDENNYESDVAASKHVMELFSEDEQQRIELDLNSYGATEVKWLISQVDWFCGTRMHSTIAGLSTGVPTTAIAYSIKTRRVFKTCNQENQVIDPRELNTADVVEGLWEGWLQRDETERSLAESLPKVIETANNQMDLIRRKIASL